MFAVAFIAASRLPRERVATREPEPTELAELRSRGIVRAATAMTLVRAAVGFTFFHLFFWFRFQDAGLVWFALSMAVASALTMVGNAVAPLIRRRWREEAMLVGSLVLIAVAGIGLSVVDLGVMGGVVLAGAVNLAAAISRLAFESIVQRDAPDANRGQAFARFETRFQLAWVAAGLVPVLVSMPGRLGFVTVGLLGMVAAIPLVAAIRRS
jgi:hypothetical protein